MNFLQGYLTGGVDDLVSQERIGGDFIHRRLP
jgi:hypothetical protein